jgi:hypothetical protein
VSEVYLVWIILTTWFREKQNPLQENEVLSINLNSKDFYFFSFSLQYKGKEIGNEGVIKLCEALKSHPSLTELELSGKLCVVSFHLTQYNTGNNINTEGAIILSKALKSITTLTSLDLSGNIFVAFDSHSIR